MFNVVGRNQDDHVKNIAFLMNRRDRWRPSPAFDIFYAWDPRGDWKNRHQMSVNGKRDKLERGDLITLANVAGFKRPRASEMLDRIIETVRRWPDFAEKAGVEEVRAAQIQNSQRIYL